jgi:hypothetical protein
VPLRYRAAEPPRIMHPSVCGATLIGAELRPGWTIVISWGAL